jgi:hypothetical protein
LADSVSQVSILLPKTNLNDLKSVGQVFIDSLLHKICEFTEEQPRQINIPFVNSLNQAVKLGFNTSIICPIAKDPFKEWAQMLAVLVNEIIRFTNICPTPACLILGNSFAKNTDIGFEKAFFENIHPDIAESKYELVVLSIQAENSEEMDNEITVSERVTTLSDYMVGKLSKASTQQKENKKLWENRKTVFSQFRHSANFVFVFQNTD